MEILGIEMMDLPEGCTAVEAVLLVKVLDSSGSVGLVERASRGLSSWESLGMAVTFADSMRSQLRDSWFASGEDDE